MTRSDQVPTDKDLKQDLAALLSQVEPYHFDLDSAFEWRTLRYGQELLRWNARHNLLSRRDEANVIRRHVSASLGVLLLESSRDGRWIDVGSGAGFPGMVLKIANPSLDITLLDSLSKRCEFLTALTEPLELPDLTVLDRRAEQHIEDGGRGSYDVVTCKAVASISKSLSAFGELLDRGGRFVTFKGPRWRDELDDAEKDGVLKQKNARFVTALRLPWTKTHVVSLLRV